MKSIKNIGDKNEELLKIFSAANKVSKTTKNKKDFNYNSRYAFYRFYKDFEKFNRMVSLDSKHSKLKEFYKLLSDIKNHKPITTKTKTIKTELWIMSVNFKINTLILTKKITVMKI